MGEVNEWQHGLRTPREEIAFTARPKIQSQSQIFRYGGSIFCLAHRPNFSDIFNLCLHWVSVVRALVHSLSRSNLFSLIFSASDSFPQFAFNHIVLKSKWKKKSTSAAQALCWFLDNHLDFFFNLFGSKYVGFVLTIKCCALQTMSRCWYAKIRIFLQIEYHLIFWDV